jgi:hypothetical protein
MGLDERGSIFGSGSDEIFSLFATASRMALGLLLWGQRTGREADHSCISSAEVKNTWSSTSTALICVHGVLLLTNFSIDIVPSKSLVCESGTGVDACTYLFTLWCKILSEKLIVTQLVKKYPVFFMKPKISLPCSQKPAIGP